ncbi:hypothetical protein PFICI_13838 [Pestalotiopsis fici W106-1]|uniref:RRM domain-containing protein n=1 Tax=Pestalotiopsis fici (strain W106-1 / CGMCC3.15140) TaxID=1229662 RepID=W3WLD1_PESFW|nr:uncharacterized protein PFICI_13838 [Pestalotiopsis fici W106-1]ETS73972.1 hypothetical protein PFICI_13838 [Pestalotiopsis fici W106-1]
MSDSANWRVRAPVDPDAQPRRNNYNNRENRDGQRPQRNPNVSQAERSRPDDLKVHRPQRQQEDSPETAAAITEGRRIYLGNLLYSTTPDDIELFLTNNGFPKFEKVHISIDPFTGRNPGYCFIEFAEKETADSAMEKLEGLPLFDRAVKCRPCQPKGNVRRAAQWPREEGNSSSYNRWGTWDKSGSAGASAGRLSGLNGPNDTMKHYQVSKAQEEGRQLYVGGLPRMLDQAENEVEIRDIFKDFEVDGVSKRVSPREEGEGRRNFCFVDFSTAEQAQAAKQAIHGMSYRDAPLKVSEATPRVERYPRRDDWSRREERSTNRDIRFE